MIRGRSPGRRVGTPAGLAWRDGVLYVCDTGSHLLHAWNFRDGTGWVIGRDDLGVPVDVAVGSTGHVYVADTARSAVLEFDSSGSFTRKLRPADRDAYRPVAVTLAGSELYVADIAGDRVDVFSTHDGAMMTTIGDRGGALGQFRHPMGVAIDGVGRLLVTDMMNARVQVFGVDHQPVLTFGQPGNRYGDLASPKHLAVGPDGTIFITDPGFEHVHLFDSSGRLLMLLGGPDRTPMPLGLTIATDVPEQIALMVPADFRVAYYVFVSNTVGGHRLSLYAVGTRR